MRGERRSRCPSSPYCIAYLCISVLLLFLAVQLGRSFTSNVKDQVAANIKSRSCRKEENKKTVMLVFGTRPEAVKMAPIIQEILKSALLKATVVSTGQHKRMLEQVLDDFELRNSLAYDLALMKPRQSLSYLSAQAITAISEVISVECPDVVLVQGDTTTAYMAALAAFYSKIPVGHVEAGLRTHDIYSPFPEEVNRQSISTMATYNFAPTNYAAENLRAEGRYENVYVTGNTVVDALMHMKKKTPSLKVETLLKRLEERALLKPNRFLLLTAHRRENIGKPLNQIFAAVSILLKTHADVSVIYPIHLNPDVLDAARAFFGNDVLNKIKSMKMFDSASPHYHLNRFLLVPPVDHSELIVLTQRCFFVMTDSGGIQEEAITLGKPVIVLRDTTERPEGVIAGASKLVGTETQEIVEVADDLLKNDTVYKTMSSSRQLFGDGNAAQKIVRILEKKSQGEKKFRDVQPLAMHNLDPAVYDLVIVMTVWKRDTVDEIFRMIRQQSILHEYRVAIILFQNGKHINVKATLRQWEISSAWGNNHVDILHVLNTVETGYFGRFLGPFAVSSSQEAFFIILDDDILFGRRYFETMLRVVAQGSLATRNGRFLGHALEEFDWRKFWAQSDVDTFDEDDEYDFGGHIWAGRISWLRTAWQHPAPILYTAEDFWLSAVLKRELGIPTKRPRCPAPMSGGDVELCACSMKIAEEHIPAKVGNSDVNEHQNTRSEAMKKVADHFNYQTILSKDPEAADNMGRGHTEIHIDLFSPSKETRDMFAQCLFWY